MANSSLVLTSLDFDTLKQNLKQFLSTQSAFKDYDFSGSNINVLLDILSYNSYLNSFYLNMVASEMFLDSAQKYESVISHAKELNYVPRSAKSSEAELTFNLETVGLGGTLSIPKNTIFSALNSNGTYNFVTDITRVYSSTNNTFTVNNLTAVPITKDEALLKLVDQPQIQTDVYVERGKNSAYERVQRLGEVDNIGDLLNYGYGFFNVQNKD